jgi:hypothetical protein
MVGWVSFQLFRRRSGGALLFPYLTWLVAVGTFFPPVSNDYNLFFLPLAALAVWDQRDRVVIHLMIAPLLLWWQPLQLAIGPGLVLFFKVMGIAAVGASLVARGQEQASMVQQEVEPAVRVLTLPDAA